MIRIKKKNEIQIFFSQIVKRKKKLLKPKKKQKRK